MAFGVTSEGFVRKRLDDIKDEIEEDLRASLGQGINLQPESVLGQIVGIVSERESLLWEQMESVYLSQYPSTSEGVNLDNVASITGAVRQTPTKSVVQGQLLFGTVGVTVTQGSVVSVEGDPNSRFVTLSDVILVAGTNEVQDISFDNDPDAGTFNIGFGGQTSADINFDDTASEVQTKLEAMSTIGTGNVSVTGAINSSTGLTITFLNPGPDGLGLRDVDTLVVSDFATLQDGGSPTTPSVAVTTPGVPQGTVNMEGEDTGATDAPTGSLSVIETAIAGWDSTVNPEDATLGQEEETDPEFRIRRELQVAEAGAATPDAIRADLLAINEVVAVVVFFNNLDIVDLDGRPGHSVDIVVQGGDEDEIAQTVFSTVGGGITFVGDITKTVKDSQNFDQTVKFSRPTEVDIHVEVDLTVDSEIFPVDGVAQVEAAILAYGNALEIGQDVVVYGSDPSLSCAFKDIPGIEDFVIRVGKTAGPTLDDNIVIDPREISDWDSARITAAVV